MKLIKKYFPWLSKNTLLLAFSSLFTDIATEMLYPIIPIFLTQNLHASGSIVGLIEGIAQATQYLVQGFSGWLSDKLKNRKIPALIGYFIATISKPLLGASTVWEGALSARFLDRFGTGMRSAPRDALLASSVEKINRGKAFGLEGVGDNLGAFLGPLIAFFLLISLNIKINYIFYIATIPSFLAFLMIIFVKERSLDSESTIKLDTKIEKFPKVYWKYLFVTALFNVGNSSNAFLILQTQAIDFSFKVTILIYAGFNLVAAIISYPSGVLSDLLGRRNILIVSFSIFFITYLGFSMTRNIYIISILFILYGCYSGIFRTVGKAFAIDFLPKSLHASGIGWYSATIGIFQLFASIIAGLLWDKISHEAVFIFGTIFSAIGIIALIYCFPSQGTPRD